MTTEKPLGSVIQGSLSKGLEVRLHADVSVEDMRVGKFLVVRGVRSHFFCMSPTCLRNIQRPHFIQSSQSQR